MVARCFIQLVMMPTLGGGGGEGLALRGKGEEQEYGYVCGKKGCQ